MRKIIVIEHISMDGVIQGPGGKEEDSSGGFSLGGWIGAYSDPVLGAFVKEQMAPPFDLLLGRRTFEIWEAYWPYHKEVWPEVNSARKYVASASRNTSAWEGAIFLTGDLAEQLMNIKEQEGPDLYVWGSGNLVQSLLKLDVIDTFRLMMYPLVLGRGKRLFAQDHPPMEFQLASSSLSPSGVHLMTYTRWRHNDDNDQRKEIR